MAIQFVGRFGSSRSGNSNTTLDQSLTSLTGGIASAPAEGDLVIVCVGIGSQGRNSSCAISGYSTLGTQLNPNTQTYDTSLQVSYKRMGSTPDTSITIPAQGNVADAQSYQIMVFRGVDATNPFDVTSVSATGTGTANFDPAAITPTTSGAWIVIAGGGALAAAADHTAPTDFTTNWTPNSGSDTNDCATAMGYYTGWTSGQYNPGAASGNTGTTASWAAWTMALRPAPEAQTLTQSSSFSNSATFYSHTLTPGTVTLTASSLFNNTNTYYTHTLADASGPQTLTQTSVYNNSPTYYTHTLTPGSVTLTASRYDNTANYYTHTLTAGAVNLTPSLYTNTNNYYTHTVTTGPVTLTASIYNNSPTFYGHTLNVGAVTLSAQRYDNTNTYYTHTVVRGPVTLTASRFDNTNTYYTHTASQATGLIPQLFTNTPTFFGHIITVGSVNLTQTQRFDNSNTFYNVLLTPYTTLTASKYDNAVSFYTHTVTPYNILTAPVITDDDTFYDHELAGGMNIFVIYVWERTA